MNFFQTVMHILMNFLNSLGKQYKLFEICVLRNWRELDFPVACRCWNSEYLVLVSNGKIRVGFDHIMVSQRWVCWEVSGHQDIFCFFPEGGSRVRSSYLRYVCLSFSLYCWPTIRTSLPTAPPLPISIGYQVTEITSSWTGGFSKLKIGINLLHPKKLLCILVLKGDEESPDNKNWQQ